MINTSSVNGFWACLGPATPHTAYSSAKFAVKGFSEALLVDLRVHAPHVKVAVVMPGHIGTQIVKNTSRILGKNVGLAMTATEVVAVRKNLTSRGVPVDGMSDDDVRRMVHQLELGFEELAPTSAAEAATIILDGVRRDAWRILVGADAEALDRLVRAKPDTAYEQSFVQDLHAEGHLRLVR